MKRLSVLSSLFDEDKLVLIPFGTDVLQIKSYFDDYESRIKSILSKEKTHEFSDFDEIVQVCDTDGCFIRDVDVVEDTSIRKIVYKTNKIIVKDRNNVLLARTNKRENIEQLLLEGKIDLYYNSTNIDHVFDNLQNPSSSDKKQKSMDMYNKYKSDGLGLLEVLVQLCPDNSSYERSWNYIKQDHHSLERATNIIHFVIKHSDSLKAEYKQRLSKLIEEANK